MALRDLVQNPDGSTDLFVPRGGDLGFTVAWGTNVLVSGECKVRDLAADAVVLDFAPYIAVVGDNLQVLVPASVTEALDDWGEGYWTFNVTTDGGSTRTVMEGRAILRRGTNQ